MLRSTYELEYPRKKGAYRLELPIDDNWDKAERRVLLVIETVDSQDLKEGKLLANRSRTVVTNLLNYCLKSTKEHGFPRGHAFAAINFNNIKFLDQSKELWPAYRAKFAKRVEAAIEQLDPTHVIVFGDRAAAVMMPDIEHLEKKRGWVLIHKLGGKKRKVTVSLDLENLYVAKKTQQQMDDDDDDEDEGEKDTYGKANLLYYVSRNVTNALCGQMLYDLSHIKARYKYVDTIPKFKKMMRKLRQAEYVAVDNETANLSCICNSIGTIQFATTTKYGWVLPVDHEQTPWSQKEIKYIKKHLRAFFFAKEGESPLKYLITMYGMFDLRVIREELKIPIIFHPVWEITAGEFMLDENLKYLKDFGKAFPRPGDSKPKPGGLAEIFASYGNDHYYTSEFKKDDRSNTALTRLDNKNFLLYGSMDVQSIVGIHKKQKARAKMLKLGEREFYPSYLNLVLKQMSNTVHNISHMKHRGNNMDMLHLAKIKGKDSPFLNLITKYEGELNDDKAVKTANKIIVKESSTGGGGKGLFNKSPWAFNWNKNDHKVTLFFSVMGLKPLTFTKKTKSPQVNKAFVKHYAPDYPTVEKYGQLSKLLKLYGTYVKGWWTKMKSDPDSAKDNRLRPNYGFFDVVTGRSNSFDPSLQQVPTRAEEAKLIKRTFVAPKGCLQIKFDYSAHEVRVWSYAGVDKLLASVFRVGQRLRQLYRVKPSEWLKAMIKLQGDIHIINVKFFFGLDVDKDHPLRDAIKQVVFGVIYGKGASTLARDIGTEVVKITLAIAALFKELKSLKALVSMNKEQKQKLKEIPRKIKDLRVRLKEAEERSTKEFAASLIEKLFTRFKKAGDWLNWAAKHAEEHYYVYSPLGMRRNLFAMMTEIKSLVSAMARRAKNSPIQGTASQIGFTTARLIALEFYKVLEELDLLDPEAKYLPSEPIKAVHDALHSETPYKFVLIYLHIVQYMATYGVTKYYEKEFGAKFTIEPEIEIEIGAHEAKGYKWDWTYDSIEKGLITMTEKTKEFDLKTCLMKALKDQKEIGYLDYEPEEALKEILWAYKDKKIKKYLDTKYPILGVTEDMYEDLEDEIKKLEKESKKAKREKETA
jgi:DNA polymerase I-like protein with 3'-5' exonuclease and polymerase domains